MVEYFLISVKDQSRLHQFGKKKSCQEDSLRTCWSRGTSWKEIIWKQTLWSWENWARQKSMLGGSLQKKKRPKNVKFFIFPIADRRTQLLGRHHEIQESTLEELQRNSDEFQPAGPKRRSSPQRHMIEWISLSITLKFFDVSRTTHTNLDWVPEKACQRLLERWWGSNFVRCVGRIHEVHVITWETSSRIIVLRRAPDEDPSNYQTRLCVTWDLDWQVDSSNKSKNGLFRSQSFIMLEKLRDIHFTDPEDE